MKRIIPLNRKLMQCRICRKVIVRNSNRQKYCSDCSKKKHKKQMKMYMKRRRELGTSDISQHRHKDVKYEKFEIEQEMKRLGVKRQFT